jgi:hypothetical protein
VCPARKASSKQRHKPGRSAKGTFWQSFMLYALCASERASEAQIVEKGCFSEDKYDEIKKSLLRTTLSKIDFLRNRQICAF